MGEGRKARKSEKPGRGVGCVYGRVGGWVDLEQGFVKLSYMVWCTLLRVSSFVGWKQCLEQPEAWCVFSVRAA